MVCKKFSEDLNLTKLLKLKKLKFILDNSNFFSNNKNNLSKTNIECIQTGEPNWI